MDPEPLPDTPSGEGPAPVLCRLCGQPLTGRTSRRWGLGPDCRNKLGLREAPTPPVVDVDQDTLPGM